MSTPEETAIKIDVDQIPAFRREALARGALELVKQVFAVPGAEERYQAWLKEYKANNRTAKAGERN